MSRGFLDARHHASLRESEALTPGEVYGFKWKIFAEDYVFARGHRMGIVIAGSNPDCLPVSRCTSPVNRNATRTTAPGRRRTSRG